MRTAGRERREKEEKKGGKGGEGKKEKGKNQSVKNPASSERKRERKSKETEGRAY
jgi:hypothetical protein